MIVGPGALAAGALGAALKASRLKLHQGRLERLQRPTYLRRAMAGLILGYAQKGGLADIEAAKPESCCCSVPTRCRPGKFAKAFKVYVGHHGDKGAAQADLVLPAAA